jgi:hypothetical protein
MLLAIAYNNCHTLHILVTVKDCLVVRSKAHLNANTEIPKLIMIEKYPRNKKRIPLKNDKPIGKPRSIEISGLFCPLVMINTMNPRTSAFKKIFSSILFLSKNYPSRIHITLHVIQLSGQVELASPP